MTSNIGVRQLKDFGAGGVGFKTKAREEAKDDMAKAVIQSALQRTFSPEFLNRVDDVVIFNSLEREHISEIIDIALKDVYKRLEEMEYKLTLSDEAKDFVAEKGFDPQYGARPLNRAIQKYLEDPLAKFILNDEMRKGALIATFDKEKQEVVITKESVEEEQEVEN